MKSDKSALMLEKARCISQKCASLKGNEEFFLLQRNLESAVSQARSAKKQPVIICIIGGTGVGKSFIFSTLCAVPDISPSSGSVRGFTRQLFISATDEDQTLLSFPPEEAHFVPGLLNGAILIDTPDLDTIDQNNARIARETISLSDIIICVTTPDKRANFSIHQNIVEWASRKRWFFAINKTDTAADVPIAKLKSDLGNRLENLGFNVDPSALFAFSARETGSSEFKRFQDTVFSQRTVTQSHILHEEAEIRRILFALNAEKSVDRLLKIYQELTTFRSTLHERILEQYRLVTTSPAITGMAGDALRASLYRELTGNGSLFLYPYFALFSWLGSGVSAETTEKAVNTAIGSNIKLSECFTSARRFLEDRQLQADSPDSAEILPARYENGQVFLQIVEEAQKKSETPLMRFYLVIGNILPLFVLLQALYRSVVSWMGGVWLPTDFFIHALFLIAVSTLPGYLLISRAAHRMSANFFLHSSQKVPNLPAFDRNINEIEKILQETSLLNSVAEAQLNDLRHQLPQDTFGISIRN